MNYLSLGFRPLGFDLAGCVADFFGLPTEGTLRIASIAEASYIPAVPIYLTGFIPNLWSWCLTVSGILFSSVAISLIEIKSAISFYYRLFCAECQQFSRCWDILLNNHLVVSEKILKIITVSGFFLLLYFPEGVIIIV